MRVATPRTDAEVVRAYSDGIQAGRVDVPGCVKVALHGGPYDGLDFPHPPGKVIGPNIGVPVDRGECWFAVYKVRESQLAADYAGIVSQATVLQAELN